MMVQKTAAEKSARNMQNMIKEYGILKERIKVHRLQGMKEFLWLWDSIYSLWTVMIILKKIW